MKILVSWLRELVPVEAGVEELADNLTRHGFEVSAIEPAPAAPRPPTARGLPAASEDAVLDIEITTNRPDCLSMIGIAREVATIYGLPVTPPPLAPAVADGDPLPVTIEDDARGLCPRYAAAVAGVTVGAAPGWMAARLEAAGVRPINNVVDLTNYVMIERGQPLHAFDLDRLAGPELRVRLARGGETVRTLDGVDHVLPGGTLVIADAARPQAVAGVMGGAASEVTAATTRVAFESAWFDPHAVRRASRRLKLATDASCRFERGADIEAQTPALQRVQALLQEIGAGAAAGAIVDRYPAPRQAAVVRLRHARIRRVLGVDVEPAFVSATLGRLGFGVDPAPGGGEWRVTVPTHRVDVSREIDLIEEVARHHGYDRLPATFPAALRPPAPPSAALVRQRRLRRVLTAGGCSEAITWGFIEEAAAAPFVDRRDDLVRIANPLAETAAVLRPALIPGLLDALVHNRRRERRDIRLFEIGCRFTAAGGETPGFGVVLAGAGAAEHWSDSARWRGGAAPPTDFFDVAGVVRRACEALGVAATFETPAGEAPGTFVAGRAAVVQAAPAGASTEVTLGHAGQLLPALATARGWPAGGEAVYAAELDLDAVARVAADHDRMVAAPLPRHPSMVRDLAVTVPAALPAATVRGTIRAVAPETLLHVREFDRYAGAGVPQGRVSLAFRLTFRAADRTLTDVEVERAVGAIVERLAAEHGAQLR